MNRPFTLAECRSLSRRAWAIRRFHAARLSIPVLSVSWRECLVLAHRESLRRSVWRLHTDILHAFPSRPAPLVGVSEPVYLPQPARSGWMSQVARAAVIVLAVLAV